MERETEGTKHQDDKILDNSEAESSEKSLYETIKDVACCSSATMPKKMCSQLTFKKSKIIAELPKKNSEHISMDEYYCKLCKAHMNSEDMWESHISGKRHLKNVRKEREVPHAPRQERNKEDLRGSSYSATEVRHPRGRSRSPVLRRKKVCTSPVDTRWRHDKFSHLEQSPSLDYIPFHLAQNLSSSDKMDLLKQLSVQLYITSEREASLVKDIVTSLVGEYIMRRSRDLCHAKRNVINTEW